MGIHWSLDQQSNLFARNLEGIFEAEEAKFKGPTRTGANDGFLGSGYLDFGSKTGEYVEWDVTITQDGSYVALPLREFRRPSPPLERGRRRGPACSFFAFCRHGQLDCVGNQDYKVDLKKGSVAFA